MHALFVKLLMIFKISSNVPTKIVILLQFSLTNNLSLNIYYIEFTPTETSAGGPPLYIANHLSYKNRNMV